MARTPTAQKQIGRAKLARRRTRRKPRRPPARNRQASRRSEFLGMIVLAATTFLLLSLYSYDAADGDLFIHIAGEPPRNLGGTVGATLAALAFQILGFGAWIGVATCGALGWCRVRGEHIPAVATKTIGSASFVAFGCVLAHYSLGEVVLGGRTAPAGGLLGMSGGHMLKDTFGSAGGPLVATTASLLSLIAVTKLSLARGASMLWSVCTATVRQGRTSIARWRERRRKRRQRRTVIKKYASQHIDEEPEPTSKIIDSGSLLTLRVPVDAARVGAPLPELLLDPDPDLEAANGPAAPRIELTETTAPIALPFEQPAGPDGDYALPEVELLQQADASQAIDQKELMEKAQAITSKAAEFRVTGEVVAIHPGPVVTTFEFRPGTGIKYSRITNLEEDLSLALKAESVRIARLPGKATVGIEVPNNARATINFRDIIESGDFQSSKSKLTLALGKQIHGETTVTDLARMPHLLIAGTTGAGKSVALNCMLLSLLYKATPDEVKVVLIDPKRLEFGLYKDIPHLLTPVVVEPKLAANALGWAVREMERRYKLLAEYGVRNIDQFNLILKRGGQELGDVDEGTEELVPLAYIVVIIDELADLMMTASNVVEEAIIRLSQMARAVGIHLILATQRPSVDVLTGVIKNNLPARMSFRVASRVDSRVILDTQGAETLLGRGDMLFLAPGTSRLSRVHAAFVTESEVKKVVGFWRDQARPAYSAEVTRPPIPAKGKGTDPAARDEFFVDAVRVVVNAGEASVSNIQRKLSLGYARAGRIMDMMEEQGIVGPPSGSKPRKVLVDSTYLTSL